jgi:hypothetical protein
VIFVLSCGLREGVDVEHDLAHPLCEFFALLFDVCEEGIGPPPSYKHYCIGRDVLEV